MCKTVAIRCLSLLIVLAMCPTAWTAEPSARPLLEELDHETQSLYREITPGIVRVELPTTRNSPDDPLFRWNGRISPEVRQRVNNGDPYVATILPASRPEGEPQQADHQQIAPPPKILLKASTRPIGWPNAVGVVVDDQGHIMVPMYADKDNLGGRKLSVTLGDGTAVEAKFIGSDRQTNITVLQVQPDQVRPMKLGFSRPKDGALVLVLTTDPSRTRLGVWTSTATDVGVVVNMDGVVAGFARRGQFLCAATCLPVVRQLVEYGHVERAFLGVRVSVVMDDDPQRQQYKTLNETPAIRITEVIPESAASRAGLLEGDLIVSMAGESVGDPSSFAAAIASRRGKTELKILREGKEVEISVDLQPPPQQK